MPYGSLATVSLLMFIIPDVKYCRFWVKALSVHANDDNSCIQQLVSTQQILNRTSERLRNQENANEILKTENERTEYFIGQAKLQQRELQSALTATKRELQRAVTLLNGTQLGAINCTEFTDDDESAYNSEKWNKNWDKRDSSPSPRASRLIFLLRHGHYEFSEPEEQITMSPLGRFQMEALGRHLASLPYNWSRVFLHSSKIRTQDAAQLVAKHLPGVQLLSSDLLWSVGRNDTTRRRTAFNTFIHRADMNNTVQTCELMMLHKSVIHYFLDRALQVPAETLQLTLPHGSITILEVESDGRVFLRELGNVDFMPHELATSTNSKWI